MDGPARLIQFQDTPAQLAIIVNVHCVYFFWFDFVLLARKSPACFAATRSRYPLDLFFFLFALNILSPFFFVRQVLDFRSFLFQNLRNATLLSCFIELMIGNTPNGKSLDTTYIPVKSVLLYCSSNLAFLVLFLFTPAKDEMFLLDTRNICNRSSKTSDRQWLLSLQVSYHSQTVVKPHKNPERGLSN